MKPSIQERLEVFLQNYSSNKERARAINLIHAWEESIGSVLTREHVTKLYGSVDELIELPTSVGVSLYPSFQFESGRILPGLMEVWKQFTPDNLDPWGLASYLMSSQPELGGHSPIEWLRSSKDLGHLIQVAREYNQILSQ